MRTWRAGAVVAALILFGEACLAAATATGPGRPAPASPRIDSGGLWVVRASGAVDALWRAPAYTTVSNPAVSPGSVRVAFTYVDDSGYPKLAVVGVDDRRFTRPMGDAWIESVGWIDDRHLIVLVFGSRRLERVDVESGERTTIWEGDDRVLSFVVSPDGRHVVFRRDCPCDRTVAARHSLFTVESDGSNPRQLLSPLHYLDNPNGMAFAPDNRHVAVLAGGRRALVDVVGGTETVLAASPQYYPEEPHQGTLHNFNSDRLQAWSPASDRVVFSYTDETVLYSTNGRHPTKIPNSGGYGGLSRDGRRLAYSAGRSGFEDLHLVKVPEMTNGRIVMRNGVSGVLWPPGGSLHALGAPPGRRADSSARALWRFSSDGADRRLLAHFPSPGWGGADNLRAAVTWSWHGPDQKEPGGVRSMYHEAVLVFLPR